MKQTVTFSMFTDAFSRMGRKEHFSYNGLKALYDYLIDYEESTGQEIELDVIALCCEYTEYKDFEEISRDYPDYGTIEKLEEETIVIEFEDGFIVQSF